MGEIDVRGDEIFLDGFMVAVLAPNAPASVREHFERLLGGVHHECQWPYCAEDE